MTDTFLGLLTTDDMNTDERPLDWIRALFIINPNGMAPFTALMGMLGSEKTGDFQFNWFEKGFPTQRFFINNAGGYLATDTALNVDNGSGTGEAKNVNQGTLLLVERTNEIMIVTNDPANDNTILVQRGIGSLGAFALVDDDGITILGSAYEQGSRSPSGIFGKQTRVFNYTQNFKQSLEETRTALMTELRWSSDGNYNELKRETLQRYGIGVEKSFLWGERALLSGPTGKPLPVTGGVVSYIPTANRVDIGTLFGGFLSEAEFENQMEQTFRFGSFERLCLCGGVALRAINQIVRGNWMPTNIEETYGIRVHTWETVHGIVHFKQHPLFTTHPLWQQTMIFLDMASGKKRRHMMPTIFRTNVQEDDADLRKDFFHGDIGGQWPHGETDRILFGVDKFAA